MFVFQTTVETLKSYNNPRWLEIIDMLTKHGYFNPDDMLWEQGYSISVTSIVKGIEVGLYAYEDHLWFGLDTADDWDKLQNAAIQLKWFGEDNVDNLSDSQWNEMMAVLDWILG